MRITYIFGYRKTQIAKINALNALKHIYVYIVCVYICVYMYAYMLCTTIITNKNQRVFRTYI